VRAVVALARAKGAKIQLAAPTGRAAKRLSELAGLEAATLHRLLQLRPGGDAAVDRDHPLDADLVVVDGVHAGCIAGQQAGQGRSTRGGCAQRAAPGRAHSVREGLAERRFGGRVYRVGDKVMQVRNNYDKGTAGCSTARSGHHRLSLEDQQLRVLLDADEVADGFEGLDELTPAYALSKHPPLPRQRVPYVVVPLTRNAWLVLQRNLLYTAVTRAKRIVVLAGSRRALAKAVRTQGAGRR